MKIITTTMFTLTIFGLGFLASEYRHHSNIVLSAATPSRVNNGENIQSLIEPPTLPASSTTTSDTNSVMQADDFSWAHINQLINNTHYDDAIRLLQKYLQTHATSAEAFRLLAHCFQKQAKPIPALEAWFRYLKLELDTKKIDIALKEIKNYLQQLNETPSLFGDDLHWLIAQFDTLLTFSANDGGLHLLMASLSIKDNDLYQAQYHALMAANDPSTQKQAEAILAKLNGKSVVDNEKNAGDITVPLIHIGNQYLVNVNIEGYSARLLLDTGASLSGVSNNYTRKYPFLLKNSKPIRLNTANGAVNSVLFTVDSLSLGELVFNQHILTQLPMDENEEFDGLLGVDILGRFDFVIDQNAGVLRLKARK